MPKGQVAWNWKDEAAREEAGFPSLLQFFNPPPQVGRPAGVPAKKRGRPPKAQQEQPASSSDAAAPEPVDAPAADPPTLVVAQSKAKASAAPEATAKVCKKQRTSYGDGAALDNLKQAIADWDGKKGAYLAEEKMSLTRFCQIVGIPYPTFAAYVCKD
eukprot:1290032-Prymnesium_polylepis.1